MENWQKAGGWVDYYFVLGLLSTAEEDTIIAVYRRLTRKYGVPGGTEPDETKFRLLNDAKSVLADGKNPSKREEYDREYHRRGAASGARPGQGSDDRRSDPSANEQPMSDAPPRRESDDSPGDDWSTRGAGYRHATGEEFEPDLPKEDRFDWTPSVPVPPVRQPINPSRTFPVSVSYKKTIAQLIRECSFDIDYQAEHVVDQEMLAAYRHPQSGVHEVNIELYQPASSLERYSQVLVDIDELGYRPANLAELLSFAAKFKLEQMKYSIQAIGTILKKSYDIHGTFVGSLSGKGYSGRGLQIIEVGRYKYYDGIRIAVVKA